MVRPMFDMDPKFYVLLRIAKTFDFGVILIAERVRLRVSCATSHEISSTDARERAISSFHGAPCGVSPRMLTCSNFSTSLPRGNRGWRLTAGAKFEMITNIEMYKTDTIVT